MIRHTPTHRHTNRQKPKTSQQTKRNCCEKNNARAHKQLFFLFFLCGHIFFLFFQHKHCPHFSTFLKTHSKFIISSCKEAKTGTFCAHAPHVPDLSQNEASAPVCFFSKNPLSPCESVMFVFFKFALPGRDWRRECVIQRFIC